MDLIICLCLAVLFLLIMIFSYFTKAKNKLLISGVAVFLALFFLFLPSEDLNGIVSFANASAVSIFRTVRVFTLGEDLFVDGFDFSGLPQWFSAIYCFLLNLLYLVAPLLTFGIILSFLSSISGNIKLMLSGRKNTYVFSCSNTRTEMLAKDILKHDASAMIVFCNTERSVFRLKRYTVCFKGDITGMNRLLLKTLTHLILFMADDDESLNISNAVRFIGKVKEDARLVKKLRANTSADAGIDMYFFSSLKKAGPLLNAMDNCGIRVRHINEIQSLVYNFIYENPILQYADKNNEIDLLVLGFGQYGEEFVKAAVWSGQDLRYRLNINVFDERAVRDRFCAKCPELVETEHLSDKSEINYNIRFFDNTDVFATRFEDIPELRKISQVFIVLGDDEKNFEAAVYLRECCERMNIRPEIHTVISSIDLDGNSYINISDHKGEKYDIGFILPDNIYTYSRIMNSELEKMGKKMFTMWSDAKSSIDYSAFYNYEFNYRSSIAATTFWHIRSRLGMNTEVSDENKRLEHWRWNAYMRSEGFRYAPIRNDIAKQHDNLVLYDELDEEIKTFDEYPIRSAAKEDTVSKPSSSPEQNDG